MSSAAGPTTICQASIRGACRTRTRRCTPARILWWRTHHARDGVALPGLSRLAGATSAATTAAHSPPPWRLSSDGGGVLEHPAYSDAWAAYDLNRPPTGGGWVNADFLGGWTCYVEQGRYGHPAKKATWLYAHGVELAHLRWGHVADCDVTALVSWCGNRVRSGESRPRVGKAAASRTPEAFRAELLAMARTAR